MGQFLMPSLGSDMEAGTLIEWMVAPGSPVHHGDAIAVVETQKGAIEIQVFEDGVLERTLVDLGATVPVGTPLAVIRTAGEGAAATPAQPVAPSLPTSQASAPVAPTPATAEPVAPTPARPKVSPAARRLAVQSGIDLAALHGSGPEGAIVLADVAARLATAAPPSPLPAPAAPGGMRAAIAAAMSRSKREIPHYYLAHTIELTAAEAWLDRQNAQRDPPERLLLGALFVKAVALAARKYPEFNGHFVDGEFRPGTAVHAGVAINIRGVGLVAPAIHDAERLELGALMAAMRDLVARVRAGRFRSSELADPTITISSLGERGVDTLFGIIYPPQVAIVGFGTPTTRAWVADGMVGPRRTVNVTLAGDHRVSDGHRGALFLSAIERHLLEPEHL